MILTYPESSFPTVFPHKNTPESSAPDMSTEKDAPFLSEGRTLFPERSHPFGKNMPTFFEKDRIERFKTCLTFQKSSAYFHSNTYIFRHFCTFIEKHELPDLIFSQSTRKDRTLFLRITKAKRPVRPTNCQITGQIPATDMRFHPASGKDTFRKEKTTRLPLLIYTASPDSNTAGKEKTACSVLEALHPFPEKNDCGLWIFLLNRNRFLPGFPKIVNKR